MRTLIRTSAVAVTAAVGLALGPVAAHASATFTGTGQGSGPDWSTAESMANAEAYGNLWEAAHAQGDNTCVNVTYNDTLTYIIPGGGGYVFSSTATALCGNYVFYPGATYSASSGNVFASTYGAAQQAAESNAYGALLTEAQSHGYSTCINVTYSDVLVYVVPSGGGDIVNSTATGLCGTQTLQ